MSAGRGLLTAATVLAAGGYALLVLAGPADPPAGQASPTPSPRTEAAIGVAAPEPALEPTPRPTASESIDVLAGDVPDQALQDLFGDGRGSPTIDTTEVIDVASQVLIADLTGQGRSHFPAFWDGSTHRVWTEVRVQAATTAPSNRSDAVDVILLWAGHSPGGAYVDRQRIVVTLIRGPAGWTPHAMDYDSELG